MGQEKVLESLESSWCFYA